MENAERDQNRVTTLIAVSSVDGVTPVKLYADPVTHRLLVDVTGSGASPLTTKGDLYTFTTTNARLPLGTDGQVLVVDTSTPSGLKWQTAGAGTGDVVGPASSTDNAIARFDSTTGKIIQNSGVTISDVNVLTAEGLIDSSLTVNQIVATNGSKQLVTLDTATYPTLAQLAFVKGVTSSIQTQLDGKQASGNYLTGLFGDGSASGPGSATLTLATVNTNVGTFGSATQATVFTVNGKGLITGASQTTITPAIGSVTGMGTGVATFLTVPSSANLAAAMSDKTGTGVLVFATSPTLVTPILGVATATSINGLTITTSTGALTIANGKTATFNNTITFAGTDSTQMTFPSSSATIARTDAGQTFTGTQIMTSPKILTSILDTNGNVVIGLVAEASAVNYAEFTNGATGNPPHIRAKGSDTNIGLHFVGKGSGMVSICDATDETKRVRFQVSGNTTGAITTIASASTAARTITLPDATTTLVGVDTTDVLLNKTVQAGKIDYVIEPAADDTFEGEMTNDILSGDTIAQWDLVYLDSTSGRWEFADADAAATAGGVLLAMSAEAKTDGQAMNVVMRGIIRNDAWTWTGAGKPLYVSTTAGALTETAPSATDDVIRVVGYTLSDDAIYFNPSNDWITHV